MFSHKHQELLESAANFNENHNSIKTLKILLAACLLTWVSKLAYRTHLDKTQFSETYHTVSCQN
jgi:TorA maturation chaperone TorD